MNHGTLPPEDVQRLLLNVLWLTDPDLWCFELQKYYYHHQLLLTMGPLLSMQRTIKPSV